MTAASLCGVNRKAATFFLCLCETIASKLKSERELIFGDTIEVDESLFAGNRKGKCGRDAAGNISVFGLLKRGGRVYRKFRGFWKMWIFII
jgi:transposase